MSGGGSGGTSDLNITVQTATPQEAKGVWIKSSPTQDAEKYLVAYYTKKGNFLANSSAINMEYTGACCGQVVVGDYLYHFGTSSSTSYKYDLRNITQVNTLNVPTVSVAKGAGAVYVESKKTIYVFYILPSNNRNLYYYKYNIETNEYTTPKEIAAYSGTLYSCSTPYYYNGVIYIAYYHQYQKNMYKLNVSSDTVSNSTAYFGGVSSGEGNKIYCVHNSEYSYTEYYVRMYNINTNSASDVFQYPETYGYAQGIYVSGNYIYLFFAGTNNYLKYSISSGTYEFIQSNITYYMNKNDNQNIADYTVNGRLYLRSRGNGVYMFQFEDSADSENMNNGDVVVIQDLAYKNPVDIVDEPNIQIGVADTYIKKNGELDGNHLSYWGDGEMWHVLKNPNNETCTVTFDTDGGGTIPSQTIVCGTVATAPSENPIKENEVFDGWYLGDKLFDFTTPIAVSTTLTAHYLAYEEVDYIQSTGTQYIDTGVVGSANNRIELDLQYTELKWQINGLYWTSSTMRNDIGMNTDSSNVAHFWWGVSTNAIDTSTQPIADYDRHTFFADCTNGSYGMDGNTVGSVTPATISDTSYTIYLGARKDGTNGSVGGQCTEKIYSAKYYVSGVLTRDFQPIKLSTGEYCMLDKVENKVYHNSGSGAFIGEGYEPTYLDYIESTGTQYIDTGIVPNSKTKMEIKLAFTSSSTSSQLNGWGASGGGEAFSVGMQGSSSSINPNNFISFVSNSYTMQTTGVTYNDNIHTFSIESGKQKFDGVQYATDTIGDTATTGQTMYLFGLHAEWQSSGAAAVAKEKLYYCKIYSNGVLIRDYMPTLDYNDVPCLYDKVTETFFYNAGTGTFNYGELT